MGLAVEDAQVEGELAAERRVAERAARQRQERTERIARLERSVLADRELLPQAERLAAALAAAVEGVRLHVTAVEALLQADREAGEGVAAELRACAAAEADVQNRLRQRGETVTAAEVRAAQAREHDQEARRELEVLAGRLGLPAQPSDEPLDPEQAAGLRVRIDRLLRRREQLGPVNPLAKAEYEEAIAHVEELERQRTDLETALRELRTFIREVLDLDPIPAGLVLPAQGPTRPSSSGGRGKAEADKGGSRQGGGAGGVGLGGMGSGAGTTGDALDPNASEHRPG